jgi:hypothetical protein
MYKQGDLLIWKQYGYSYAYIVLKTNTERGTYDFLRWTNSSHAKLISGEIDLFKNDIINTRPGWVFCRDPGLWSDVNYD